MVGLRLLTATLVAAALTSCGNGSDDGQALAVQECKDSVQAHLNYDADFPFAEPTPEKDPSGGWQVSGTVTAQNGFGAKRTLHWTCTVDSDGNVQSDLA